MKRLFELNKMSFIIIIFCAVAGYVITYTALNNDLINNPSYPAKFKVVYLDSISIRFIREAKDTTISNINASNNIEDKQGTVFNRSPIFLIWFTLIILLVTIASGAFPVFVWRLFILKKKFMLKWKHIIISFISAVLLIVFLVGLMGSMKGLYKPPHVIEKFGILLHNGNLIAYIVEAVLILELPIMMVIFLTAIASDNVKLTDISQGNIKNAVEKITFLNKLLMNALQVLAVIIIFTVLTTTALGQSIKHEIIIENKDFDIFPKEASYIYGLFFSLFLAIIFIPVYLLVQYKGKQLKEQITGKTLIMEDVEKKENQEYQNLIASLDKENSIVDNIKLVLTVISPLITSFLPEQLHIFSN